jgi:RimJ/RimL family protein N-acetyltransferase
VVTLRPISPGDAPTVAAAVAASRDALRRWRGWYGDDYDVRAASEWIRGAVASAAAGTGAQFAILDGDALVGVVGLEDVSEESGGGRAMIGYWLATPAAGRGVGRRAVALALARARARRGLRVVWAVVAEANRASRRVLEINQFRLVGARGVDERGDVALLYERELDEPAA